MLLNAFLVPVVVAQTVTWSEKVTAIGTAVIAGGVLFAAAGAWLAWNQLRETRRGHAIELVAEYGRRWDIPPLSDARAKRAQLNGDDLAKMVDDWIAKKPPAALSLLLTIPNYFEDLAIVVEFGGIDLEFVAKEFSALVLFEWKYWEPTVRTVQRNLDAEAYREFERLWVIFDERERRTRLT